MAGKGRDLAERRWHNELLEVRGSRGAGSGRKLSRQIKRQMSKARRRLDRKQEVCQD